MGCALRDGLLKVAAHPHAETRQVIASRDLGEQREVEAWGLVHRRDAHQALEGQAKAAAFGDQGVRVVNGAARLLILVTGVYLNEEVGARTSLLRDAGDGAGEFGAVDGVDGVEQLHRGAGFVGLQGADQVEVDVVKALAKGGPFALRLLHPVFTEDAMALFQHGLDPVQGLDLADGNQVDVGVAVVLLGCGGKAGLDIFEAHGPVLFLVLKKKRAGARPALSVSNPKGD